MIQRKGVHGGDFDESQALAKIIRELVCMCEINPYMHNLGDPSNFVPPKLPAIAIWYLSHGINFCVDFLIERMHRNSSTITILLYNTL